MKKLDMRKPSVQTKLTIKEGSCLEALTRKLDKRNKTGYKGVFLTSYGKYRATIGFKGKMYYLGDYNTVNGARIARAKAEREMHQPFIEKYRKEKSHATGRNKEAENQSGFNGNR